ncbi:MAG: hypothetical protein WBN81_12695 [Gammaproteobacteria bacterium]
MLRQLARLQPGIKVVILAPLEIKTMQEELRVMGIQRERMTIILRSGIPGNRSELERVALDYASSVIILSTDANRASFARSLCRIRIRHPHGTGAPGWWTDPCPAAGAVDWLDGYHP